jgi:hypothetical protein
VCVCVIIENIRFERRCEYGRHAKIVEALLFSLFRFCQFCSNGMRGVKKI